MKGKVLQKGLLVMVLLTQMSVFAQNFKFGKVSKEELEEKFHPLDSSASAAYLYRYRKTYYVLSGKGYYVQMKEVHERIKIYNKEGFVKASKEIPYRKMASLKAVTYNLVDGEIKKTKLNKKNTFDTEQRKYFFTKKLTMPDVKEGSVIEFKYKVTMQSARNISELQFQFDIPVNRLFYETLIPERLSMNPAPKGYYYIKPEKKRIQKTFTSSNKPQHTYQGDQPINYKNSYSVNVSKYRGENIPALKDDEPYVANIKDYRGRVKYEYTSTWDVEVRYLYSFRRFREELKKSNYFKNDISGVSGLATDREKLEKIYQLVKSKVKWNKYNSIFPSGVRKAYKEGKGNSADINLMLTSMLRSIGLKASPVLVSTRGNGLPLFPTIDGFNYIITKVHLDGEEILLDATEEYAPPGVLPIRVLNWSGREVQQDGTSSLVNLMTSAPATQEHTVTAKITEDMMLEGMLRSKFSNLSALNYRNRYNSLKEEDVLSKLEEDYNIEIENFKVRNKFALSKPINQMMKFSSEDLLEEIGNKIYINPLMFFTIANNPFKAEERKLPVDFESTWKRKYTVSIQVPKGYRIESIPKSYGVGMQNNKNVFKYQLKQLGDKVHIVCILQFNESKILPSFYQELKEFYRKIVEKQAEKIVLSKS